MDVVAQAEAHWAALLGTAGCLTSGSAGGAVARLAQELEPVQGRPRLAAPIALSAQQGPQRISETVTYLRIKINTELADIAKDNWGEIINKIKEDLHHWEP